MIAGILSGGYIDNVWLAIVRSGPAAGLVSLFYSQPGVPEIPGRDLPRVLITEGLDPSSIKSVSALRSLMEHITLFETSKDGVARYAREAPV